MDSKEHREERIKLETAFAKNFELVIDQLINSQFSTEDIDAFVNSAKVFLKFEDIKQFIIDFLYDKILEVSKIIKLNDTYRFLSYSRLIGVIIEIGDEELTDSLETYLARDQMPKHFFVFLQEKIKRGMPTDKAEKVFIEIFSYDLKLVEQFLKIVGKDKHYMLQQLMQLANPFTRLQKYITDLIADNPDNIDTYIVPALLEYEGDLNKYLELVKAVIYHTDRFTHSLLERGKRKCPLEFWTFILSNYTVLTPLIKNFRTYLKEYYPARVEEFEDIFLITANSQPIVDYAIAVSDSNKRKVLRRLVELKNEKSLVQFINNFPEYKSLLPML